MERYVSMRSAQIVQFEGLKLGPLPSLALREGAAANGTRAQSGPPVYKGIKKVGGEKVWSFGGGGRIDIF